MKQLKDTQAAYISGLVDGEGCIQLLKQKKHRDEWYCPEISIAATNLDLVRWLLITTGIGNDYRTVNDDK